MTASRPGAFTPVPATTQSISPELQRVVQIFCATYESIDLLIETTLKAAESDFLSALPELKDHENEVRQLIRLLLSGLRSTTYDGSDQPLLVRFAYQDEGDLVEQLLSGASARLVVVPLEGELLLHADVREFGA